MPTACLAIVRGILPPFQTLTARQCDSSLIRLCDDTNISTAYALCNEGGRVRWRRQNRSRGKRDRASDAPSDPSLGVDSEFTLSAKVVFHLHHLTLPVDWLAGRHISSPRPRKHACARPLEACGCESRVSCRISVTMCPPSTGRWCGSRTVVRKPSLTLLPEYLPSLERYGSQVTIFDDEENADLAAPVLTVSQAFLTTPSDASWRRFRLPIHLALL